MPFFCYTISVVEATDFTKKSFMEWVEGAVFTPAQGIKVEVSKIEYGSVTLSRCEACKLKWASSNIIETVAKVKWQLLNEKKYVLQLVCGFVYIIYIIICMHTLYHRMIVYVDWVMLYVQPICMALLMVSQRP